jgi:hypothetical protein
MDCTILVLQSRVMITMQVGGELLSMGNLGCRIGILCGNC